MSTKKSAASSPYLNVYASGRIIFSPGALQLTQLSVGCGVNFFIDEDDEANAYLAKATANDKESFDIKPVNSQDGAGYCQNSAIATQLLGPSVPKAKLLIAGIPTAMPGDATKYWGILKPI